MSFLSLQALLETKSLDAVVPEGVLEIEDGVLSKAYSWSQATSPQFQ